MEDTGQDATLAFSIVIPCYNEQGAIADTVAHLSETLGDASDHEIIVVNDGSTDRTSAILKSLDPKNSNLRVVDHQTNRGYGAALKTGIRRANADFIAITDADGTYPNERLRELVAQARDVDMVVGARTGKNVQYSKIRAIPKVFLKLYASWVARQNIPDINSGMRVFRKDLALRYMSILPDSFSFTITITLAFLTSYRNVVFTPIDYSPRIGKSKIKPIRDTLRFVQLIARTGMYFAPLRIIAPLLVFLALALIASLSYDIFIIQNLTDKTVLLFLFLMNAGMFALLADMIDKRTNQF